MNLLAGFICPYHVPHRSGRGPAGISQRPSRRHLEWPRGCYDTLALPHDQTLIPSERGALAISAGALLILQPPQNVDKSVSSHHPMARSLNLGRGCGISGTFGSSDVCFGPQDPGLAADQGSRRGLPGERLGAHPDRPHGRRCVATVSVGVHGFVTAACLVQLLCRPEIPRQAGVRSAKLPQAAQPEGPLGRGCRSACRRAAAVSLDSSICTGFSRCPLPTRTADGQYQLVGQLTAVARADGSLAFAVLATGYGAAGVSMWNQRDRSLVPRSLIAFMR